MFLFSFLCCGRFHLFFGENSTLNQTENDTQKTTASLCRKHDLFQKNLFVQRNDHVVLFCVELPVKSNVEVPTVNGQFVRGSGNHLNHW